MGIHKVLLVRVNSSINIAPPPLGLMYVASYLRSRRPDIDLKILDGRTGKLSDAEMVKRISDYQPDILGISAMHVEAKDIHNIAGLAKKAVRGAKIVVGGPYACADYEKVLADDNIDFAVVGEGEETFNELVGALSDEAREIGKIKGLAHKNGADVVFSGFRAFIDNIDNLPFPAWDLLDLNNYFYGKVRALENPLQIHKRAVPVFSSRGCPYQCTYCHNIFGKKFRARSPDNILEEMKLLKYKYGVREIEFLDDSFNMDKARAHRIFDLILKEGLGLKICFSNGIRLDRVDKELLDKMKQAGVYRINYGIESSSKRIQGIIKKNLNIDIAQDVINMTVDRGMLCGGFFMIGFPTETEEDVLQTINFAIASRLHTAVFAIVTPFPSTEMYNNAVRFADLRSVDFSTVQKVSLNLSKVPYERLEELRFYAYKKFYIDPARALRIFLAAPAKAPVFRNGLEVMKVAFLRKVLYG